MLEARQLSFSYGDISVLKDVSLEVRAGEVLALIGPNGSGKTTLLKNLSGVLPGSAVFFNERSLDDWTTRELARKLAAVEAELDSRFDFSVREIIELGRIPHTARWQVLSQRDRDIVDECIERVGLSDLSERAIGELSSGERQRVWIAMALAQQPEVLLLDEPTAHLDVNFQMAVLDVLHSLASEGMAVAFSVHDLTLAALYADRVALMQRGRLVAEGVPGEVLTENRLSEVWDTPITVLRNEREEIRAIVPRR